MGDLEQTVQNANGDIVSYLVSCVFSPLCSNWLGRVETLLTLGRTRGSCWVLIMKPYVINMLRLC